MPSCTPSHRWVLILVFATSVACKDNREHEAGPKVAQAPASAAATKDTKREPLAALPEPAAEADVTKILAQEKFQGIGLGSPQADVEKVMATPFRKGGWTERTNLGIATQLWAYKEITLILEKKQGDESGPVTVRRISFPKDSRLKTHQGIEIGSSRNDVIAAYGKYLLRGAPPSDAKRSPESRIGDKPLSERNVWHVGAGGTMRFYFDADRVTRVELGPDIRD